MRIRWSRLSIALLAGLSAAQNLPLNYRIETIAGVDRMRDGVQATNTLLTAPWGVAFGPSDVLFVADSEAHVIRRRNSNGTVSVIAGTGQAGFSGDGGPATSAQLNSPNGIAVDAQGNLYIADTGNRRVRRVTPDGTITTIAGTGTSGIAGLGGPASQAQLTTPRKVFSVPEGVIGIVDSGGHRILVVTSAGTLNAIAGTGTAGYSGDGGPATAAQLNAPFDAQYDATGNLILTDEGNHRIRSISPQGVITTIAGDGTFNSSPDDQRPTRVGGPGALAIDRTRGTIYFYEFFSNSVRAILRNSGLLTSMTRRDTAVIGFGGDGVAGSVMAIAVPRGLAVASDGALVIADAGNNRIREIRDDQGFFPGLTVRRNATIMGTDGAFGDGGPAASAGLFLPNYLAFDNQQRLLISDNRNYRVRAIATDGTISTVLGTAGPGLGNVTSAPTNFSITNPVGVGVDTSGAVFVATNPFGPIRGARLATLSGGVASAFRNDMPSSTEYRGIAFSLNGELLLADSGNARIYRVPRTGPPVVVAGTGLNDTSLGGTGNGGPATSAPLANLQDIAVLPNGDILTAENSLVPVRRIDIRTGIISTFAGGGTIPVGTTPIRATDALLSGATGVSSDESGNVYITQVNRILRVDASGQIVQIAGRGSSATGASGTTGFAGDGNHALGALLNNPRKAIADRAGNVFFADSFNHRVRVLRPITGLRLTATSGDGQLGAVGQPLAQPLVVTVTTAEGRPFAGMPIQFSVTAGTSILGTVTPITANAQTISVTTNESGVAQIFAQPRAAGSSTVEASGAGLTPVRFAVGTAATLPVITPGGVLTPFTWGGRQTITPGSFIEIYGSNFAATTRKWDDSFVDGLAPTTLDGVRVTIGGRPAFIAFVSPVQINAVVPDGIVPASGSGNVDVVVTNAQGTGRPFSVPVAAVSPGLLTWAGAVPNSRLAWALFAGGGPSGPFAGPTGLLPGPQFRPARPGDVVQLFMMGLGATNPAVPAGRIPRQ